MKALLVIDIQEKYLSYYSADLVSKINARIAATKSDRDPVFYVRNIGIHGNTASYALAKDLLIVSDHIYEKRFPSAFTNDSFTKELKSLNVTNLEVIGVDGNSCVKKTCLDAVNTGYRVTLNLKCTAARNEKIFEKTLKELSDAGVLMIDA